MKIKDTLYFSSTEMKSILKIPDCELMHMRSSGNLQFQKLGNAFWYQLPTDSSLLSHPLGVQLIDWYKGRHPVDIDNTPQSPKTIQSLEMLVAEILLPVERKFGSTLITYGFTSAALSRYIVKNSRSGTAPNIDQHASHEINSKLNEICDRGGSACDFIIEGKSMAEVIRFITTELNYDRIYFYGNNRPVHVSVGNNPKRLLQLMCESKLGQRYPGKKSFGDSAILLAEYL